MDYVESFQSLCTDYLHTADKNLGFCRLVKSTTSDKAKRLDQLEEKVICIVLKKNLFRAGGCLIAASGC